MRESDPSAEVGAVPRGEAAVGARCARGRVDPACHDEAADDAGRCAMSSCVNWESRHLGGGLTGRTDVSSVPWTVHVRPMQRAGRPLSQFAASARRGRLALPCGSPRTARPTMRWPLGLATTSRAFLFYAIQIALASRSNRSLSCILPKTDTGRLTIGEAALLPLPPEGCG